jgi:hypothetical protein
MIKNSTFATLVQQCRHMGRNDLCMERVAIVLYYE